MTRAPMILLAIGGLAGCAIDPDDGDTLTAGVDRVAAAGESPTRCVTLDLGNPAPIAVTAIAATFDGADRVTISRTADGDDELGVAHDCAPLDRDRAPLLIAVASGQALALPDGVGFALAAHQRVVVELHRADAGAAQAQHVALDLTVADRPIAAAAEVAYVETSAIELPPNAAHVVDAMIAPPPALAGARFVAFTGHTRRLGFGVVVATATDATAAKVPVYLPASFAPDAPATTVLERPIGVPPGGGFYLQCRYYNTTLDVVRAGDRLGDEACGFWTTYYAEAAR